MENETLDNEALRRVSDSIIAGRKIEAIKTYRELVGCGLKEAKEGVEAIERSLAVDHPELLEKKSGCAAILVFGFMAACAVWQVSPLV